MDISLNISTSAVNKPAKSTPKLFAPSIARKQKSNGFEFNFVKNDKIKAVVARKRPQKPIENKTETSKSNITPVVAPPKQKQPQKTTDNNAVSKEKILPKPAKAKEDVDSLLNIAKVKKPEEDASLSLNINTNVDLSKIPANKLPFGEKKKKLSREERKTRVMQRRIEAAQVKDEKRKQNVNQNRPGTSKPAKRMESLFKNNPDVPVVGQRFVKPLNEIVFTGLPMDSIGLHPHLVKSMADLIGITELTNVQQRTVPVALEGRDILVRSQTGSGKTLAYALPIVHQLQEIRPKITRTDGIRALIIVPTRELAIQTLEVFTKLLKPFTWLVPTYITGGEKRKSEKARLRKGINILIGTPGRICDHLLHTESFKLDQVKYLVLDEADRLYEFGYEKDVQIIVEALNKVPVPKNPFAAKAKALLRPKDDSDEEAKKEETSESKPSNLQSLLLSATLSASVQQLAGLALKNPLFIDTCDQKNVELPKTIPIVGVSNFNDTVEEAISTENIVIPETVTQSYILVPPKLRLVTLAGLIATQTNLPNKESKILVFLATENLVDFHFDLISETLTKKVIDSDDEDGNESDDDDPIEALLDDSDAEIDEDELIAKTKAKAGPRKKSNEKPILGDVKFFKLHGSLTQQERSAIFKAFKEAKSGVLLTTDVTARGIDVPMVDMVVQFSSPHKIADYVHRVGRTARAGRSGSAVLFLAPNEVEFVRTLETKRIRISQYDYKNYLKGIQANSDLLTGTLEEMASELQRKFEALVAEDKDIYEKACKAFVSWLRFISSFPKDLRPIFNVKNAHMGHYAKSLALREPPKSFTKQFSEPKAPLPNNRLTYTDRSNDKAKSEQRAQSVKKNGMKRPAASLNKFVSKSISLSTSEFGSGLPEMKKRKK